jgi:hypothetical protein
VLLPNETLEQAKSNRPLTWNTTWTLEHASERLAEQIEVKAKFEAGLLKPRHIIGTGYKSSAVARRLAVAYLIESVANYEAMVAELSLVYPLTA